MEWNQGRVLVLTNKIRERLKMYPNATATKIGLTGPDFFEVPNPTVSLEELRAVAKRQGIEESYMDWQDLPEAFALAPQSLVNETAEMRARQTSGATVYEVAGWKMPVYSAVGGEMTLEDRRRIDATHCYGSPEGWARQAFSKLYGKQVLTLGSPGEPYPFVPAIEKAWGLRPIPQRKLTREDLRQHP